MAHHRIITRHLLRRRARASLEYLQEVKRQGVNGGREEERKMRVLGLKPADRLVVERAGRVRARWVVAAIR